MITVIPNTARAVLLSFHPENSSFADPTEQKQQQQLAVIRSVHLLASISLLQDVHTDMQQAKTKAVESIPSVADDTGVVSTSSTKPKLSFVVDFASEMLQRVIASWTSFASMMTAQQTSIISELTQVCTAVLAVVSDALMLQILPASMCRSLEALAEHIAGVTRLIVYHPQPQLDHSSAATNSKQQSKQSTQSLTCVQVMLTAVARVCSVLASKCSEALHKHNSNALLSFACILVIPLEIAEGGVQLTTTHRTVAARTLAALSNSNNNTSISTPSSSSSSSQVQLRACLDTIVRAVVAGIGSAKAEHSQKLANQTQNEGENHINHNHNGDFIEPEPDLATLIYSTPMKEFVDSFRVGLAAVNILQALERWMRVTAESEVNTMTEEAAAQNAMLWSTFIHTSNSSSNNNNSAPALGEKSHGGFEDKINSIVAEINALALAVSTRAEKEDVSDTAVTAAKKTRTHRNKTK